MPHQYVLRERDDDEINRLKFQHQVWNAETQLAIEKADVNKGDKIIDLGCGPGYLSYDLLERVGENGQIFSLDNSEKFISFIREQEIENIHPIQLDIREELPKYFDQLNQTDMVFCRWVLMFTGNEDSIVEEIYKILKPGGRFVSIEYFNFRQISMFPQSDAFDHIFKNVWNLLKNGGGDPDMGGKMYQIMLENGFHKVDVFPVYKTGKAGSPLWQWLAQTNLNHQNLVNAGLITESELAGFYTDWEEKSKNEVAFITAPPLMITVGEK